MNFRSCRLSIGYNRSDSTVGWLGTRDSFRWKSDVCVIFIIIECFKGFLHTLSNWICLYVKWRDLTFFNPWSFTSSFFRNQVSSFFLWIKTYYSTKRYLGPPYTVCKRDIGYTKNYCIFKTLVKQEWKSILFYEKQMTNFYILYTHKKPYCRSLPVCAWVHSKSLRNSWKPKN